MRPSPELTGDVVDDGGVEAASNVRLVEFHVLDEKANLGGQCFADVRRFRKSAASTLHPVLRFQFVEQVVDGEDLRNVRCQGIRRGSETRMWLVRAVVKYGGVCLERLGVERDVHGEVGCQHTVRWVWRGIRLRNMNIEVGCQEVGSLSW